MPFFNHITKAAKDFFVEEATPAGAAVPLVARPWPGALPASAGATSTATPLLPLAAPLAQPEQRHLDHIQGLLTGDGQDFMAYTKMVQSLAASGLSGALLYQTAYRAFAAVARLDRAGLLASAEQFARKLTADRNTVLERHREKLGEIQVPNVPPSALVQLQRQAGHQEAELTDLTRQLAAKQQQLEATRQQLQEQQLKATAALASYELAHAAAAAELQAHRHAAQSFLASEK